MTTAPVAAFEGVRKTYRVGLLARRRLDAVRDVTFEVHSGEVFGLLGPNRAGKTTLVKLLLSLCTPTTGHVQRLGRPASDLRTLGRVGYVHENPAFPRYWNAYGLLQYYGALSLLEEPVVRQRSSEWLERVGLADRAQEPIAGYSKGMVQRLALAQALLTDPELLVLDEPAEGLDLLGRKLVHEVIGERRAAGRTVILVSHALTDVTSLCDRVAVLVGGQLTHLGPLDSLTKSADTEAPRPLEAALQTLYARAVA